MVSVLGHSCESDPHSHQQLRCQVETGGQLMEHAGATMQEIVQGITRVRDIMSEIASAGAEQTVGIEQVNEAITQMDAVTQPTSSQSSANGN